MPSTSPPTARTAIISARPKPTTPSSSISACPRSTASPCSTAGARKGRKFPVLVLTARDSWSDKVAGLDAGADDYLAKPFQTEELIARLRALIRRASGNASSELTAGDVRLDTRSGKVTLDGEPVKLTAQEYKLLSYLMHHKGKVVSRTELIEHIYDQDFDRDSNTIEVFVTRIRKKLGRRRHHHHPRPRLQPRGAARWHASSGPAWTSHEASALAASFTPAGSRACRRRSACGCAAAAWSCWSRPAPGPQARAQRLADPAHDRRLGGLDRAAARRSAASRSTAS